ncbi:phage tail protein [Vibrio fluvialis]|uniref:phage tail-collar fiber domain-containing protein n=1 Tax=Vibrio fluvialis TaxID=676 RepID=UPI001EE9BE2F|nr:phage tail protein [Vibrio fluvialis]MCG6368900.1 phage tail protein [Vibrio fluvialis]MCG6377664.1 phage tail protein [Vibrio fluvialis]
MSLTAIPLQFEKYLQNQISVGNGPDMNEMIFAYIPDLDLTQPIDRSQGLPDVSLWVHQQDIDQVGKLGDNALVYSVVIPGSVDAFTFNAIYLRDKNVPNSCGMVVHKADETKEDGMASTKSLMQQYTGAAQIAGIDVDAATWQIDYQARLFGIEEDMRLAKLDNYGHTAFVDGFDVTQQADPTKYAISAGVAYIGGLRAVLDAEVIQTINTKPNGIYLDVVRMGTVLSEWQNIVTIRLSDVELVDYLDGSNQQHYVAKLAGINADGSVSDWRVKGGLGAHEAASDPHTQYLTRADWLKHMLFKGMPMSAVGPDPDSDIWLPAGRVELLRADYPTVFEIVSASAFFTDQATIDANPRLYAGHWGTGDGATTFTTDDWALMMNIKVAGGYGAAGTTKEDHIQNITGNISNMLHYTTSGVDFLMPQGAFAASYGGGSTVYYDPATSVNNNRDILIFDASLVARTDTYTDTMGLFLDHYRVIPKGVFSYA